MSPEPGQDAARGAARDFAEDLGRRVRGLRKDRALTVQQLADLCGVSRRMLTQIELGQANPSLGTVGKIAAALRTDFAGLATGSGERPGGEPVTVVPPEAAVRPWASAQGSAALLHVAAARRGGPELWQWELAGGDAYQAQPDPAGSEELFLVLSGQLTLLVQACGPVLLAPGCAARLATDRAYGYRNDGDVPVRFIRVVDVASAGA